MPSRRTQDVVHVVMTDHRIQRRPPPGDLTAPLAEHESQVDDVEFLDRAEVPEGAIGELHRAVTVLRSMPRNDAATQYLARHLDVTPSLVPRFDLIAAYLAQQKYRAVLDVIGTLGDEAKKDPRLRDWRGIAQVGVGATGDGLADLQAAVDADPDLPNFNSISRPCFIASAETKKRCRI